MPTTPTPVTVKQTSKQFTLNIPDLLQSLVMAAVAPVIPIINTVLAGGTFEFPWQKMGVAAATGLVGWLSVKFFSASKTIVTGTTEGTSINVMAPPAGTTKSVNIAPSIPPTINKQ